MKRLHNLNIKSFFVGLIPTLLILYSISTTTIASAGTPDPASGHTFSIVAVDPETGAVGSAGASCIDGSSRISSIVIGRGAIHAQALLDPRNRDNATQRMLLGESPQEIIEWLIRNDIRNDPQQRQYGIVDFDENGEPRSAGFTGTDTFAFQNHITGTTYAIQGNILSGQVVLDNMEENFNSTTGSLAERLMQSLQGANLAGADTRCLRFGTSSLSAFIRVACPSDTARSVHLDLDINSVARGVEPLDLLQEQFDAWLQGVESPVCADTPPTTPTVSATATSQPIPTQQPLPALTRTTTNVPLPTLIPSATQTPLPVRINTSTATNTPLPTLIPSTTQTPLATRINTSTATNTPLPTLIPSATQTPLATRINTSTATNTPLPTLIPSATQTPLPTRINTSTATNTPLPTLIPSATQTPLPTLTATSTRTLIPLIVLTATRTPLPTLTNTPVPSNTPAQTATPEPIGIIGQLGDSNCDSKVNAVDALSILRYGVRLLEGIASCGEDSEAISLEACDVSGNDKCNAVDALFIFQCDIGLSNVFCE